MTYYRKLIAWAGLSWILVGAALLMSQRSTLITEAHGLLPAFGLIVAGFGALSFANHLKEPPR